MLLILSKKKHGLIREQKTSGDAINRQWLIECVNEGWIKFDTEKDKNRFIHLIRDIAPQSKTETITEFADRCCECGAKYGKLLKQKGGVMTYGNGEMPNGGWTPISEGTPKENKTVIASTKYGVYPEARYSKEYGWEWAYEAGADYWRELEDVEAWMPLPKRYEPQIESEE